MEIHSDKEFWTTLQWPAAPNLDDYYVFESYCKGRVLLLGSTRLLLPLVDEAWDLEPKYDDPKIKQKDWLSMDEYWDTVIMDGGIALGKEFTDSLLAAVLPNCDRLIVRSFLNPTWKTKYAVYFPRREDLTPQPDEYPISEVYTFYIWNKDQQY